MFQRLGNRQISPSGRLYPPGRSPLRDGVEPEAAKLITFPILLYPPSEIAFRFHGVNMSPPLIDRYSLREVYHNKGSFASIFNTLSAFSAI